MTTKGNNLRSRVARPGACTHYIVEVNLVLTEFAPLRESDMQHPSSGYRRLLNPFGHFLVALLVGWFSGTPVSLALD